MVMKVTYRERLDLSLPPDAEPERRVVSVGVQPGDDREFVEDMLNCALRVARYNWLQAETTYRKALRKNVPDAWRLGDEAQHQYSHLYRLKGVLHGVVEEPAEQPLVVLQYEAQSLHDGVLEGVRLTGNRANLGRIVYGPEWPVSFPDAGFNPYGM